ncbi:M20/M25/M40 family metallo-hydrolase [uncultured Apibacter sp.]|uniref:M28 family metallopeptidase n=1 Tax=uncultured Apibacter sp. TaxID=1778616 RepID=UPI0026015A0C|nr:M20/M25/M40 family metallo-hydrolase [uncultured Apibacter sp.]
MRITKSGFLIIISLLVFFSISFSIAQTPKVYAEQVIKKLTSSEFSGRGYVDDGMKKASEEIASQFEKIGILKFQNSYFQPFTYPINIIEKSSVSVNGKELKFGSDYLVGAGSPSLQGDFSPITFNASVIESLFESQDFSYFNKEMKRIDKNCVIFPNKVFPENMTMQDKTANELYHDIPQLISNGELDISAPLIIQLTSSKFIHSLSPIQTKTVDLFINSQSVPETITSVSLDINTRFEPNFEAKNVIGFIKGKRSDSLIVLTAHYDHLGKINDVIFPGANDNASGIALLLSMAKVYKQNTPDFDTVFIAFAGEEAGLKGSQYFVDHSLFDLNKIKFLLNFDIVGTGEEGIQVVNGKEFYKQFNKLENISYMYNYLKQVKIRGSACNSDHCPFYEKGVPSFYIYTLGGKSGYHDIYDKEVSLYAFDKLIALLTKFINAL